MKFPKTEIIEVIKIILLLITAISLCFIAYKVKPKNDNKTVKTQAIIELIQEMKIEINSINEGVSSIQGEIDTIINEGFNCNF